MHNMQRQAHRQSAQITGANIRAARDDRQLTQRELAESIAALVPDSKLVAADVSRWETGLIEPGPKYRFALAEVLFEGNLAAMYAEPEQVAA
jgi:transcriptional regulator with XRE-family HTH domain